MPWLVFAEAVGIKFWHLTTLFKKTHSGHREDQRVGNGRNGEPELGIHPTRSGRPGLWRYTGVVV